MNGNETPCFVDQQNKQNMKISLQRGTSLGNLIYVVGVLSLSFCDIFPTRFLGFMFEIHKDIQTTTPFS